MERLAPGATAGERAERCELGPVAIGLGPGLGGGRGEAVDLVLEERLLLGGASRVGRHQVSQPVAVGSQGVDRRESCADGFGGVGCLDPALVGQRDADRRHLRLAAAQAIRQRGDGLLGRGAGLEAELVAGGVDVGARAGAGQARRRSPRRSRGGSAITWVVSVVWPCAGNGCDTYARRICAASRRGLSNGALAAVGQAQGGLAESRVDARHLAADPVANRSEIRVNNSRADDDHVAGVQAVRPARERHARLAELALLPADRLRPRVQRVELLVRRLRHDQRPPARRPVGLRRLERAVLRPALLGLEDDQAPLRVARQRPLVLARAEHRLVAAVGRVLGPHDP